MRTPRRHALRTTCAGAAGAVLTAACAIHPPVLNQRAIGCFDVDVTGWTTEMTELVGADPPRSVRLDPDFAYHGSTWRKAWPTDWDQHTQWDNTFSDWLALDGDTVIQVPYGPDHFHVLAHDSIILDWTSRKAIGSVTVFLASTKTGFAGLGMLYPRPMARHMETPFFRLERTTCR